MGRHASPSLLWAHHVARRPIDCENEGAKALDPHYFLAAMSTARKRLIKDFKKLRKDPPDGISAAPSEENLMEWQAVIIGCVASAAPALACARLPRVTPAPPCCHPLHQSR